MKNDEKSFPVSAQKKTMSDSVLDTTVLFESFMDNVKTILSLLPRFIERTEGQLKTLPELEKTGDWETARREAHTIKGAAFTMGGVELGEAAARLELAYKNTDKDEMEAAFPQLKEALERYKKAADEFSRQRM